MERASKEKLLIESIRSGGNKRYAAIEAIYSDNFPSVQSYILRNSGFKEDAKDVFQEGMTIFYGNIISGQFKEQSSLKTYLFSICKNLWLLKLRKRDSGLVSIEAIENQPEHPIDELNNHLLDTLIQALKTDCQKILIGYYYEHKSMEELAVVFKLGSEQATRNKKMRCMKELMRIVKEKNLTAQNFLA